jgi:hypothetical protein
MTTQMSLKTEIYVINTKESDVRILRSQREVTKESNVINLWALN